MARPPALYLTEVVVRCPSGSRLIRVPGPTAAAAVREGIKVDPKKYGASCVVESRQLVERGRGLSGPRRRRRRRRR